MRSEKELTRISKFLSLVLRHQPQSIGITLDENGWTEVSTLLEKSAQAGVALDLPTLQYLVQTNSKQRFAFNAAADKIRASQGHSVPVELGYEAQQPPEVLYHGTTTSAVEDILLTGLQKQNRHHVHLSSDVDTALKVGQRHGKPYVFEVMAGEMFRNNFLFYQSANGVWLTEEVPPQYLRSPFA